MTFEQFDILGVPLAGTNLIEASAGTGKTYTIAGLYLRLILEKRFKVDQILVVTFTKSATEELKQRIRLRLLEARQAFMAGESDDKLLGALVRQSRDPEISLGRITDAIRDFDACAIFTIHGFCQRILHENAFETGSLFDTELVTEQRDILIPICEDYWRNTLYEAPPEFVRYALLKLKGPETLLQLLAKSKDPDLRVIPRQDKPSLPSLETFRKCCQSIAKAWPEVRGEVKTLLMDAALNGTAYGSFKPDKQQPDLSIREVRVKRLLSAMDGFCAKPGLRFPLFKEFDKFRATFIELKTKKGTAVPSHPFFIKCDELGLSGERLLQEMQALLLFVKADLFRFAHEKMPLFKEKRNVQYFDDLLTRVRDALLKPGAGLLSSAVKRRFKVALVDEFQDTDMLQYTIFSRLFAEKGSLFFMIGDPKQAIYGFRGADIFSYMHASARADKKYTLLTNYRSHAQLITAVNTLFSRVEKPFVYNEIPFSKGMAAEKGETRTEEPKGLFEIRFAASDTGSPLNKGDAEQFISVATAREILGLVKGPERVNPGNIAVLVRTNFQAEMVKKDLSRNHVPAVIYSAGNVFETREARDMFLLLVSIADPFKQGRFRAALATDILGIPLEHLDLENDDEKWMEPFMSRFMEYHQTWARHGFMRMFNRLMGREHVKARLLGIAEGERKLTNLLHLAELLHDCTVRAGMGMPALIKWFSMQRDPQSGTPETHQLRLESDALTVKIVTIHKSKGLEFPIVFCPFAWGSSTVKGDGFTFHDPENEQRLTLDLGSPALEDNRTRAQYELLAENLRLLYVALTRARQRCIMAWGRIKGMETSALAYLLHYQADEDTDAPSEDLLREIQFQYRSKDEKALIRDLQSLETASDHAIQVSILQKPTPPFPADTAEGASMATAAAADKLVVRETGIQVERDWHIYSYSSLTSSRKTMPVQGAVLVTNSASLPDVHPHDVFPKSEQPDRDETTHFDESPVVQHEDGGSIGKHTIFSFAKGAQAGIFFHELFEHLDFTTQGNQGLASHVADKIKAYGIDPVWQNAITQMIENVLSVPLASDYDEFSLSMIPSQQRINEMEFYFPLQKISVESLKNAFKVQAGGSKLNGLPEHMGRLQFAPAQGFMKGFIDLVFGFNGRYYLADWKSNHLGYALEDYNPGALETVMQRSYYTLQYHIYTLALHLFLQGRLPGYQYEENFGGVFYLFIRGIDCNRGSEYGVFYDRPSKKLVESLENTMVPG
ncbi:MAG: exodeoxyribonuclease V subunit beta [Thermodesulfobacteriota bacterium]